jgi:transglutaminase-like putative cysteine protease
MASAANRSSIPASTQPLPAVQRYFEISLYSLICTGMLAVLSTGKLDIVTVLVAPAALIFKGLRIARGHGPEISARFATGLVLGYFLFFPFDLWVWSRNLSVGAPNPALYAALLSAMHLLLFATLVRLYSARTNRDYAFLAVLAVTSMLGSAILTVETSFLIALAIFLVLAVSTFVALEIQRSAAGAISPPFDSGSPMARQLNRALGLTSGLVAIGTLAIGCVLFFMIPRFTAGYLSALNLQPALMTGFSDNVTLGEIGKIKQNTEVVMRVSIDGDPLRAQTMHWRGVVLTNFDGKRWFTPTQEPTVVLPSADGDYTIDAARFPDADFRPLRYTVLLEPIGTDAIFIAPRVESLRGHFTNETDRPGSGARRSYLVVDKTGSVFNPFHNDTKVRYEGVSNVPMIPPAMLRKAGSDYPDIIRGLYLQLPLLDPRVKPLAEEIAASSKNPYDKAANIERYLKTRYAYTLDLRGPKVDDPLAYFLFSRRAGHCEYFAAAMTVMLRTLGIPSRYVSGFLPGEFNDLGGDYIIRASDAHTWVEAYFPGYGWITFDPTPSGDAKPTGMLSRLALYWDWFQFAWSEWIINYDFGHQVTLAQNLQKSSRDWSERLQRYYRKKQEQALNFIVALDKKIEASPYFLPGALLFLILVLFALRGRSMLGYVITRWSLRARRGGNLTASLAALEYREMLRLLEKRGWKKAPSQTPHEFASAIPAAEFSAPVGQLTQLYQSARFGDHPAPVEQMSSLLRSIRDLLRSRTPSAR